MQCPEDPKFFNDPNYDLAEFRQEVLEFLSLGHFYVLVSRGVHFDRFAAKFHLPLNILEFAPAPKPGDANVAIWDSAHFLNHDRDHARRRVRRWPNEQSIERHAALLDSFFRKIDELKDQDLRKSLIEVLFFFSNQMSMTATEISKRTGYEYYIGVQNKPAVEAFLEQNLPFLTDDPDDSPDSD